MNRISRLIIALGATALAVSPVIAHDTSAEAANKKVVIDFYAALDAADAKGTTAKDIKGIAEKYLSPEYRQQAEMYRNLPGPGNDRDKLIRMFQTMPTMKAPAKPTTLAVMAEKDLVMQLTSRELPALGGKPASKVLIFNMFRVKNGKLVEHWDTNGGGGAPTAGMSPAGMSPPGMAPPPGMTPPPGPAPQ